MSERPDWKTYFLNLCRQVATRSLDVNTQVGCVITNMNHRVVATGYNSFPAGVDDCFWPRERGQFVRVPKVGMDVKWNIDANGKQFFQHELDDRNSYLVDKYVVMAHAEKNAIAASGQDLHGCVLYTLLHPCHDCAQLVITAGIRTVVFEQTREDSSWAVAKLLLRQAGVACLGPDKPPET